MKKMIALLLVSCVMLSGCSYWMNGSYSSVEPHTEPSNQQEKQSVNVASYEQIAETLISMVELGAESGVLTMEYEKDETAQADLEGAIAAVRQNNPFAAYAVEQISYTMGTSGGRKTAGVRITYLPNRVRTDKIQRVQTPEEVQTIVSQCLDACDAGVVLFLDNPEQIDYAQMVADYALTYPQRVMEAPEVTVQLYPEQGQQQVVELRFTYQTSRVELRTLQNKVEPVFASALRHTDGEWTEQEKAERLYSFLMERYEYTIQTSITPAYSLLLYGIGDSRAFAVVYGAMCRQAELDCRVVTGTREGVNWVWNAVRIDGEYYYLDLLRCNSENGFRLYAQEEMTDYVWDYSAYPITE